MIYFIRHGQTDWVIEKKLQGKMDIPLNNNGRRQAEEAAKEIATLKIDRIISSDLSRAKETAEIINKRIGVKITFDKRLREENYGEYEGRRVESITAEQWKILNELPEKVKAESRPQLYERAKDFISNLKDVGNTLIVTHAALLRMILYYSQNRDGYNKDSYNKFAENLIIDNAKVIEYKEK